jgi:hypothetical protein
MWLLFFGLLGACGTLEGTARTKFAESKSCPEDRITIRETQVPVGEPPRPPPADVAADPARLAVWNETQQRNAEETPVRTVYVAEGCGTLQRYTCWRPRRNSSHGLQCAELAAGETPPVRVNVFGEPVSD